MFQLSNFRYNYALKQMRYVLLSIFLFSVQKTEASNRMSMMK